ncbi:MAG: hypothetical protein NWE96_11465 [Candidatus Bathyarchaeota archaeon]|nr:hypothetical protein [Candidatus Bathyarchaeota archaeon]
MPHRLCYHFSQSFKVQAQAAYHWCVDYSPDDPSLMGEDNAKQEVTWIAKTVVLLKETFHTKSGVIEKQKLVHLYPDQLMWVSTHISGPNKHSQFIYEIKPEGDGGSCLEFTAHHIEQKENLTSQEQKVLTDRLCKADCDLWKRLAKAMEKELTPQPPHK